MLTPELCQPPRHWHGVQRRTEARGQPLVLGRVPHASTRDGGTDDTTVSCRGGKWLRAREFAALRPACVCKVREGRHGMVLTASMDQNFSTDACAHNRFFMLAA